MIKKIHYGVGLRIIFWGRIEKKPQIFGCSKNLSYLCAVKQLKRDRTMTQKEKQLLLQDLCARLPYGVICNTPQGDGHLCSINQTIFGTEYGVNIKATTRDYFNDREICIKPYLRHLSSMTDEEKEEQSKIVMQSMSCSLDNSESATTMLNDWFLSKHFDVRGLIPKGLAITVDENNNPYKE
jgi:hypothetical protein